MGLGDFIRVFGCEGAQPYIVLGLLAFCAAEVILSRIRNWDSYASRFWFGLFAAAGVILGGAVYFFIHGNCVALPA